MTGSRRWLLTLAALAIAAVVLFPIYWMVLTAVLPSELTRSRVPVLVPKLSAVSLDAFVAVLARKPVLTWLGNSMAVTLGATVVSLTIATLAGRSGPDLFAVSQTNREHSSANVGIGIRHLRVRELDAPDI